ncbi:MAG: indole-3-glycerol phosphate synthase TrpC [Elusimicrobia bacterium]|nr:indole-3-glycerol phosphate synthase TrpC [Elusimicrobiota bacterium]
MSVLDDILARTRGRVERLKAERPADTLRADALYAREPRDFRRAFLKGGPCVIAEIKFSSPSKGAIYPGEASAAQAARIASEYLASGAVALSVLTEPEFFKGDAAFLRRVRQEHPRAPLLMKDFVVDVYQLHLARWAGADAVLLIAAALGRRLPLLLEGAQALGLAALVEVHDEAEMADACKAGAALIGVNSRDLMTLKTDLGVARRLALEGKSAAGSRAVLIAESGITCRAQLEELAALGYRGFLVGTSLMATGRPGEALKELLAG